MNGSEFLKKLKRLGKQNNIAVRFETFEKRPLSPNLCVAFRF